MYHGEESAATNMEVEDDSPWMEDEHDHVTGPGQSDHRVAQQEWDKLALRYSDAGYRDGITQGKLARLQTGFDQGFALAAPLARDVGILRGVAGNLLTLLTTSSASKHAGPVKAAVAANSANSGSSSFGSEVESEAVVVQELRAIVSALGRLDESKVVPVDQEALDHAREHEQDPNGVGPSQAQLDRADLDEMNRLLEGVPLGSARDVKGNDPDDESNGVEGLRKRLEVVLDKCGIKDVLPPPRRG